MMSDLGSGAGKVIINIRKNIQFYNFILRIILVNLLLFHIFFTNCMNKHRKHKIITICLLYRVVVPADQ